MPASAGLLALGKPCFDLIFRTGNNVLAGQMMAVGSFAVLTFSLSTVCVGIMQGCGFYWEPIKNYVLAMATHIPLLFLALYVLKWEIRAVVVCYVLYALACCVFNLISLHKTIGYRQEWLKTFVLTGAASLIMGGAAYGCYKLLYSLGLRNTISLIGSILVAIAVYFALLCLLKAVGEEELNSLPKGAALARLARKLRLIR